MHLFRLSTPWTVVALVAFAAHGNVGQLVDVASNGAIVAKYEYDAYGNVVASSGSYAGANPFRFSTKYFDVETGLSYFGYRYYNAPLGRWMSRDPLGELGGLNLLSYLSSAPINYSDPLGLAPGDWWDPRTVALLLAIARSPIDAAYQELYGDDYPGGLTEARRWTEMLICEMPAADAASREIAIAALEGRPVDPELGITISFGATTSGLASIADAVGGADLATGRWMGRVERSVRFSAGAVQLGGWTLTGIDLSSSATRALLGAAAREAAEVASAQGAAVVARRLSTEPIGGISECACPGEGSFSIIDWSSYPNGAPRPRGPFRLLEGQEYLAARQAANQANQALREADPAAFMDLQIHEVQPVKFGGSPTDLSNKLLLTIEDHAEFTKWWNTMMNNIYGD